MSHADEFAGRLRERIVIERPLEERSATGTRTSEWVEVARCLAAVQARGAGAEREGMALSAMGRFIILIRWRGGVRVGQRVRWRDRRLIIRQLVEDPSKPDRIQLNCEELRT